MVANTTVQTTITDIGLQTTSTYISTMVDNITQTIVDQTSTSGSTNELDPTKKKVKQAFDIALVVCVCVAMLAIGAVIKLDNIKAHFRRPIGMVIGLVCQFIVLPGVTFGIAHALQLSQWRAIGVILMGTSPGGSVSNMLTYYMDGDVPLSVCMTGASTVIGIGMMPLNAWIYSRSWAQSETVIPYVSIIVGLATMMIPVVLGMIILAKWPKVANWLIRIGSILGAFMVLALIVVFAYLYPQVFVNGWKMWVGAAALASIALTISYTAATIFRLPRASRKAISIEVAVQNSSLVISLIALAYDEELYEELSEFPAVYTVLDLGVLFLIAGLYRCQKLIRNRGDEVEKKPTSVGENGIKVISYKENYLDKKASNTINVYPKTQM